ncbi:hypothetical protein [Geomesophilobacter sediminis]|uniref:Lipoprotein n=1 Tax=Geomesophilobacter sediminis TaxID=2798584 RepID=A0A8J7IVF6_9BACT|nr:hypothetical protein [Geomesophilobacter sediminis]MBJ6723092.1 hypothetical protein [Geomesophilobacter sediminis]
MRLVAIFLAAALLAGCESVQDSLVRQYFLDQGMSDQYGTYIREELERKMAAPPPANLAPRRIAPQSLDQG